MNLKTSKFIEELSEAKPNSKNMKEQATYPGRNWKKIFFKVLNIFLRIEKSLESQLIPPRVTRVVSTGCPITFGSVRIG
jgi:hypothetical protein